MDRHYIIMTWPEVQYWMDEPEFKNHSYLMNDEKGIEEYGSSAYFVDVLWMNERQQYWGTIENYVVDLINNSIVKVLEPHIDDFMSRCEAHSIIPHGGAYDIDKQGNVIGKYFYTETK